MKTEIKPELDIPTGYELAEPMPQIPIEKHGHRYCLSLDGKVHDIHGSYYAYPHFILRKTVPVWQWPMWLGGEFLAVDSFGNILIFSHQPSPAGSAWSHSEGWCIRVNIVINIEWPKSKEWQDSLIAKSDCEIV